MNRLRSLKYLLGALLVTSGSCFAQFGYVTQVPAGGGVVPQSAPMPYNAPVGGTFGNQAYGNPTGMVQQGAGSMLTYGQLQGSYDYTTFKDKSLDAAHGIGLSLTAQLFNPFFVRGQFNWSGGNGKELSKDGYTFSTVGIGGGGYFQITPRVHLVAEIGGLYSSLSANKDSVSFTNGAIYVNPFFRLAATEDLELNVGIMMSSATDYNSRLLELAGYYKLFTSMDLGFGADLGDQQNVYHLGVRFRW